MTWWVYIIGPTCGFPVKVGFSSNLLKRIALLQKGSWDDLVIFKKYPVENKAQALRMERMIHKELDLLNGMEWNKRNTRITGEWFNVFSDDAISAAEKAFEYQKKLGELIDKENWPDEKSSFYGYIE